MRDKIVGVEAITSYSRAAKVNLHSLLQYALIHAGIKCGFVAVPEYKIHLDVAIDKTVLDKRFDGNRKQHQLRADVAFIGKRIGGLGEIYTLDEIHGCQPSHKLKTPWLSPRDKLVHLVNCNKDKIGDFLILVNVFPRKKSTKLPWPDSKTHPIEEWEKIWKQLASDLRTKGTDVRMVCVHENGVKLNLSCSH